METAQLLNSLADASVRSLCLAAAAMIAIAVVRTRSAPVKHAVWTAVVCAMLVLPVLSVVLPAIPLRVLAPTAISVEPLPEVVSGPQAAGPVKVKPAPEPASAGMGWPEFVAIAYAVIAAALVGKFVLGYLLSARLVRRSAPIEDAAKVPGAVLVESSAVSVPLTVGWRRPHILLPAGWREWDGSKLAAVLAHEAAHVARRDWLVAALARLNTSIFWFHPLAWWMERKLAALAEEACDESSLAATGDRERYAEVLLEMAAAVRRADGRVVWHAVTMARHSQVRQRVEAILDESRRLSRGMTKARWAAVLLCAVPLAYGAAALRFEQAPAAVQSEMKAPWASGSYMDTVARGNALTPEQARQLEGYLQANPEDLAARSSLIAYYTVTGAREQRLKHIFWLVENHPESEFAGYTSADMSARDGILNAESDYARMRDLWREQIRLHETDLRVLTQAMKFFVRSSADQEMAADLAKRAYATQKDGKWIQVLAGVYARVIIGALHPRGPRAGELPDDPALAERFKAELMGSNDAFLVLNTVSLVGMLIRQGGGGPELAPAVDLEEKLRKRASELGVPQPGGRTMFGAVPPLPPPPPFVERPVMPGYPPAAKQARIQGVVTLSLRVDKDGKLLGANVVSGHSLLVPAASEAVKKWLFRPWLVNGQPVETTWTVEASFSLRPGAQGEPEKESIGLRISQNGRPQYVMNLGSPLPPPPGGVTGSVPGGVGGGVAGGVVGGVVGSGVAGGIVGAGPAPTVLERVPPVYPPLARQARIQGTVRLRAEVATDGRVVSMRLVAGHPLLVAAAQEALQQWKFKPAEKDGQPIQASTMVDVDFTLPSGETPASAGAAQPQRIRVGGQVQMANLIEKVEPDYPPLARQARIQGTVRFNVVVGPDGHVNNIQLESGHPLLVPAAQEAVRQWVYRPTLLNGVPVEVVTQVDVPFTLQEPQ